MLLNGVEHAWNPSARLLMHCLYDEYLVAFHSQCKLHLDRTKYSHHTRFNIALGIPRPRSLGILIPPKSMDFLRATYLEAISSFCLFHLFSQTPLFLSSCLRTSVLTMRSKRCHPHCWEEKRKLQSGGFPTTRWPPKRLQMGGGIPQGAVGASVAVLIYSFFCLTCSSLVVGLLLSYGESWTCEIEV